MKLYTYPPAPNPRRVAIFMAEKNIQIPAVHVDLLKGEQLTPVFRGKNPNCDVPVLELDDGTCISQINGICRYLEARFPENPLYGTTPEEIGLIEMWDHLCFSNGFYSVAEVFRNGPKWAEGRALVGPHNYDKIPQLVDRGLLRIENFFHDLDSHLGTSEYIVGARFSVADITAFAAIDFAKWVKAEVPESYSNLHRWYAMIAERPSVVTS